MIKSLAYITLLVSVLACTNSPELETGEIKALQLLKDAMSKKNKRQRTFDARKFLTREKINEAGVPVLFVQLETGQNGTLTPYPGQGFGETWLGADGATITLEKGIFKASRGMGNDLMGGASSIPSWSEIGNSKKYYREMRYLSGDNKSYTRRFDCTVNTVAEKKIINVWELSFHVKEFIEICSDEDGEIKNFYYVDDQQIVRRSFQYHSQTLGYVITERIDP